MYKSRYSLNSFGESSSASMASLSSEDDRHIFSPGPSSPTNLKFEDERNTPDSLSPSLSPLPPRHNYSLANHITMEDNLDDIKETNDECEIGCGTQCRGRNRTLSESNYQQNQRKQRESISSVASSTDSAKARVSSRNARNLRRAKSCRNNSRDGSSMGRQSGSTSSLTKKPLSETKRTAYTKNEVTFGVRKAQYGRRGWMVMPLEDSVDLQAFKPEVMDTVTSKIRTMELSGITVPNQIKIRLSEC